MLSSVSSDDLDARRAKFLGRIEITAVESVEGSAEDVLGLLEATRPLNHGHNSMEILNGHRLDGDAARWAGSPLSRENPGAARKALLPCEAALSSTLGGDARLACGEHCQRSASESCGAPASDETQHCAREGLPAIARDRWCRHGDRLKQMTLGTGRALGASYDKAILFSGVDSHRQPGATSSGPIAGPLSVAPESRPSWWRSPLPYQRCRRPSWRRPRGFAIRSRRR